MKTNTTLTTLYLSGDDKIEKENKEIKQRNEKWNEMIIKITNENENNDNDREKTTTTNENEQITILETQERQQ